MASLREQILNSVVQPYNNSVFDTLLAEIVEYNNVTNRASIEFQDPKGPGMIHLDDVPVQIGSGGVHSAGPFKGDQVWVSFQNKSPLHPKIVALADEGYQYRTRERSRHSRKGAFIPDTICARNEYTQELDISNLTPAIDDWFDHSNQDISKYADFETINPFNVLLEKTAGLSYYNSEEPGITHPLNSSTIKIRNNGMIDIFVATNQGIRIDPYTKTINILGNTEKHHVNEFDIFADDNIKMSAQRDVSVEAEKNLSLKGKSVSIATGQIDSNITGKWTVLADGDVNIVSKGKVTVESGKNVILRGQKIVLDGDLVVDRDEIVRIINEEE